MLCKYTVNIKHSTSVTQDRSLHRVQGHALFSWQLSSLMSHRECMLAQQATPLSKAGATESRTAHAPAVTGVAWESRDSCACSEHHFRGVMSPGGNAQLTTRLEQDLNRDNLNRNYAWGKWQIVWVHWIYVIPIHLHVTRTYTYNISK